MRWPIGVSLFVLVLSITGCAPNLRRPDLTPRAKVAQPTRQGLASYYGKAFDGNITASGVRFDMDAMVAAHPSYPFGTVVRVTNLKNGRSVQVRIVDRGPARGPRAAGVIIDLSQGAAAVLDFVRDGRTRVRLEIVRWAN